MDVDPPPSEVALTDILRRSPAAARGYWTHIVRSPQTFRCAVTDHASAGMLYRSVWRYRDSGLCVLERRLWPGGGRGATHPLIPCDPPEPAAGRGPRAPAGDASSRAGLRPRPPPSGAAGPATPARRPRS